MSYTERSHIEDAKELKMKIRKRILSTLLIDRSVAFGVFAICVQN